MTPGSELQPWFFIFIIPAFIVFWCAVGYFVIYESGWLTLNRKFALTHPFVGEKSYCNSGKIGPTWARGVLTIGINNEGLHLSLLRIWAIGAKPLLIPWKDLHNVRREKVLFSGYYAVIDVDDPKITTIRIPWTFIEKSPLNANSKAAEIN